MKLPYLQLAQHITKGLAPVYLICSDELLLAEEAAEMLRNAATQSGFTERVRITPEASTNWSEILYSDSHSLSLFATKKIIELNLNLIKFNAAAGKIIADYVAKPLPDTIIIILAPKCDAKTEKSNWYQAIEKNGVVIPIWPLTLDQLPAWIMQRGKKLSLTITKPVADRLAALVEGNLLAAAQEIEKLSLLQPNSVITEQLIDDAVTDHAHFDIFNLVESTIAGNKKRSLHILKSLSAEGEEPTLILWALVREIRMLADMLQQSKKGTPLSALFSQYRIWEKRQAAIRAFLQRHQVESCWNLLLQAAKIDRVIKGAENGDTWVELESLIITA